LRTRSRYWSLAAALVSVTAGLAGCGSSTTTTSGGGTAFDVSPYKDALSKLTGNAQWNGPTAPAKAPASEKAFIVTCSDAIEGCRLAKEGLQHALTDLKWEQHTQVIDDPAGYSQGVQTALNQGATIIFLPGIPQEVISGPLTQANANHIPTVSVAQNNLPIAGGVSADVSPDGAAEGKAIADAMIVNNNGKADALFLADAEFGLPVAILNAARKELATCTTCKVETDLNFTAAEIQTTLPSRVTAALLANPNVNSVLVGYDPPIPTLAPAIDNAGLGQKVKLYSQIGTAGALKFLRAGDVLVADIGSSEDWNAYACVDEGIRLLDGMPLVQENLPIKVMTKDNAPPEGKPFSGDGVDYPSKYKALWGIA
jgi:ABC-type sugar transport system substrate-binding protein